jgi:hypothetical protein
MIIQFGDHDYIDVDSIKAIRWIPDNNVGVVFIGGQKMIVSKEDFDILEKCYNWSFGASMYGKNLKLKAREGGK